MSPAVFDAVAMGVKIAVVWGAVLALGVPILTWAERRVAGLIQDRPGPNRVGPMGLFQPLADAVKFFMKEDVVPQFADKVLHFAAPLIVFVPALSTFSVLPFGRSIPVTVGGTTREVPLVIADINVGALVLFALTSLGVYGIVLAGWSSNSKYSLLGGLRSSAQIISYELAMGFAAVGVFLSAGSLRLQSIVEAQHAGIWNVVPQFVGCVIFVVAAFAETNRLPFDLAEADSELVGGFHTEYSSFRFGMFFMAEYANMVAASALIVTLYLGGWSLPGLTLTGLVGGLLSVAIFAAKTVFLLFVFLWVRWTLPRFRYDQLMALGWKVFVPLSLLHLFYVAALVAVRAKA